MKRMLGIKIRASALVMLITLLVGRIGNYFLSENRAVNFLVVGVDNASWNTDVISVVRLDPNIGRISYVQIPRDTYCNLEVHKNKINHIFSEARAKGKNSEDAVSDLKSFLTEELSIKLDGHILIDGETFCKLVDSIGGVDVELSEDLVLYNGDKPVMTLSKGSNHLDSHAAILFVRHRAGYLRGDLDRLEMQNVFIRGLFDTLMNKVSATDLFRVADILKECETDIPTRALISIYSNRKTFASTHPIGSVLPGVAMKGRNGVWYYALNRRACDELISTLFSVERGSFDKGMHFLNASDQDFKDVYFR